jgi:hypothetical protein
VWVAGADGTIWMYNRKTWSQTNGGLTNIAVDNHGNPWGTNAAKQIWSSAPLADPTAYQKGFLNAGESLVQGQYLASPNGSVYTVMQPDGNLCTYAAPRGANNRYVYPVPGKDAVWCHQKTAPGSRFVLAMQADGNLCTYRGTYNTYNGGATWCSNAVAGGGQFHVAQLDDGNLCVYNGAGPGNSNPMWCRTGLIIAAGGWPLTADDHGMAVFMTGAKDRWEFTADGSIRNVVSGKCLAAGDGYEMIESCGSSRTKGWSYGAADHKLRNTAFPNRCALPSGNSVLVMMSGCDSNWGGVTLSQ